MQINLTNPFWGRFNGGQNSFQQSNTFAAPVNNFSQTSQTMFNNTGNNLSFGQSSGFGGGFSGGLGGGLSDAIQQMLQMFQMVMSQCMGGGGINCIEPPFNPNSFPGGGQPFLNDNDLFNIPTGPSIADDPPVYNGGNGGCFWGDPHLVGFDGEKYDVMGKSGNIYNMLSDKNVQYNTKFEAWGNDGATIISEAGLQVGQDQVHFDRSGKAPTVNGQALKKGQNVPLDGGGSATWDGKKLVVNTGEYTIDLAVQDNPKGKYLDSNVKINAGGPFKDFVAPHGLLGQTADGQAGAKKGDLGKDQGKQGGNVIDGTVADYQETSLFSNSSKYNRFGVQIGGVNRNQQGQIQEVADAQGRIIFRKPSAPVGKQGGATAP